jgi:serpin B
MSLNSRHWIAAVALAAACTEGTAPAPAPDLLTKLPRALTSQEAALIESGNAFTLALFQKASAAQPEKNVFLSPLSASMALGMTLNGARTSTFDAMRTALQFGTMSQADINASYKSLISLLTGLDATIESRIANSIWYRNTLPIDPAFVSAGRDYFDAEVSALDFNQSAPAVQTINNWVSDKTAGRIPTIVDAITPDHMMILINAVYFKATWRNAFNPAATQMETFTTGTGAQQTVPLMHLEGEDLGVRGATWADGSQSLELPYGNGAFNMTVILPPDTSTVERFVSRLTLERIAFAGSDRISTLQFWMPRVKLEYKRTLVDDLSALGMGIAFSDAADLSGMTTTGLGLKISDVLQKTFLSIDEEGTEAAAVTKVDIFTTSSSGPSPLVMRCDRPYLVVIREKLSGTIMFIGKINVI